MRMGKLILSIDNGVVLRAKRFARRDGLSISQMVEAYLDIVTQPSRSVAEVAPILRSLRGSLKKASVKAYQRRLAAKYR